MAITQMDYTGGGGGSVQYALSFSQYVNGSAGAYIGFMFDTEGNRIDNVAGTSINDYVEITLSGNASASTITVKAKKAGTYHVLGRRLAGSTSTDISTSANKNVGDIIFTNTESNSSRYVYINLWLDA